MVNIQQDSTVSANFASELSALGEITVGIDTSLIKNDMARLNDERANAMNSRDQNNIDVVIAYLDRIYKRSKTGEYQYNWYLNEEKLKVYPLDLRNYKQYKIRATDYVILGQGKMVRISYAAVLRAIAFDIMFNDLDEDFKSIEDKLKDIGIAGSHPIELLDKYIDKSILDLSKCLRVSKTPYASLDERVMFDYFGHKTFTDSKYKGCVEYSVDIALNIITHHIISRCGSNGIDFKLCAVNEDGVYLLIDDLHGNDLHTAFDSVVVRAFGRRFEEKPDVTVF